MKRLAIFLAVAAASVPSFAQYKEPVVQDMYKAYQADKAWIDAVNFQNPGAEIKLDCMDEDTLRVAGGVAQFYGDQKKAVDKAVRKGLREAGFDPNDQQEQIVELKVYPIAGECVNGKLEGKVKVFASYTKYSQLNLAGATDGQSAGSTNRTVQQTSQIVERMFKNGVNTNEGVMVMQNVFQQKMTFEDKNVQEHSDKMNKAAGLGGPMTSKTVLYTRGKVVGTFMAMKEPKFSAGLFGMSKTEVDTLTIMAMFPIDETHGKSVSYKDGNIIAESYTKNGVGHGPSIMYMENFAKKLGQPLSKMPGMEDAREAVVDGRDVIIKEMCMQNGKMVKTVDCPKD